MIFLVYLLNERHELRENPMPMRRRPGGELINDQPEYVTRYVPDLLGAYDGGEGDEGEAGQRAVVAAASDTRRFGQYVAVKAEVMTLDFSAKALPALPATVEGDELDAG